jgi:hypothetical protein
LEIACCDDSHADVHNDLQGESCGELIGAVRERLREIKRTVELEKKANELEKRAIEDRDAKLARDLEKVRGLLLGISFEDKVSETCYSSRWHSRKMRR